MAAATARAGAGSSANAGPLQRLWAMVQTSFWALVTFWRLAIGTVNKWILYLQYGGKPRTDFYHKVVLLGDGLAAGFGSWVSLASASGLVKYLNEGMERRRPPAKMDWVFFERGVVGSGSRDWLPGPGRHLDRVLASRAAGDVDMVVLLVGLQDIMQIKDPGTLVALADGTAPQKQHRGTTDEERKDNNNDESSASAATAPLVASSTDVATAAAADPGEALVGNLRSIVEYLVREKGVRVCLCNLPPVGAPTSVRARAIAGVNRRIQAMVDSLSPSDKKVVLVEVSQRRVARPEGRAFDGVHFCGAGYQAMAEAILDELVPVMVKMEWSILQDYVSGRKQKPKGGLAGAATAAAGGGTWLPWRRAGGGGGGGAPPFSSSTSEGPETKKVK